MNQNQRRLVDPRCIPETLWDHRSGTLKLPQALAQVYIDLIDSKGIRSLALSRSPGEHPVGGISQEQTDKHFAQAFDGSAARMELAVLDPMDATSPSSNELIRSVLGHHVCIIEAPCGAGATAFSLLATIAELRAQRVLPRLPLDVVLIGADFSTYARDYAREVLGHMATTLEEQAVFVKGEFVPWDVTDKMSNTDLIQTITLRSARVNRRLLVVANFNGFLERNGNRKRSQAQLEELFRHVSGEGSFAIWIEPCMNRAIANGGLLRWICTLLGTSWKRFVRILGVNVSDDPIRTCFSHFKIPIDPDHTARVGLAIIGMQLSRSEK
ncbi:MAG: hypothetical protein LLG20_21105 [Acidobacteriales bacterium]|nr:hypothetical protein [Terriglobales bacterium]